MPDFNISDHCDLGEVTAVEFVRRNENEIYRVTAERGSFVLRIHDSAGGIDTGLIRGGAGPALTGSLLEGIRSGGGFDMSAVRLCQAYQAVMFIAGQHGLICTQPWYQEALDCWCSGLLTQALRRQPYDENIGLYSM